MAVHPENTHNTHEDEDSSEEKESPPLTKFFNSLDPEDNTKFSRSLSLEEKVELSSSEEEFNMLFPNEELERDFPKGKGEFQRNTRFTGITEDRIKERFEKMKESFPEKKTIDGLRKLSDHEPHSGSPVRSTNDLREARDPLVKIVINLGDIRNKANGS